MKRPPKYQRITALRAVDMLRKLARARGTGDPSTMAYELNEACDALEEHVKAELTRKRR